MPRASLEYDESLTAASRWLVKAAQQPLHSEELERLANQLFRWRGVNARRLLRHRPLAGHPSLIRFLISRSLVLVHHNPPEALAWAELGLECARASRAMVPSTAFRADLRAEAWASISNVLRVMENYDQAERGWRRSLIFEKLGTGDGVLAGKLASIRASLRRDQRRFDEAQLELSRARSCFEMVREDQLQGKASLSLATILFERGAPIEALQNVSSSLRLLDPQREPEAFFLSLHELVLVLTELGHHRHALALGELIERLYFVYTGVVFRLRGLWVKGKIHTGLREWEVAAHYFALVRDGFLERQMPYDAALAGLDLALAYAEQGKHFEVYLLARDMYEVFCAQQIPREASAALILFADAALRSQADVALILSTIRRLDALRREAVSDQSALRWTAPTA